MIRPKEDLPCHLYVIQEGIKGTVIKCTVL